MCKSFDDIKSLYAPIINTYIGFKLLFVYILFVRYAIIIALHPDLLFLILHTQKIHSILYE